MGFSISGLASNVVGTLTGAANTVEQAAEDLAPQNLKQTVSNLAGSVDEFVSNNAQNLTAQLGGATAPPPLTTPAQVKAEYTKDAKKDLTAPGTLRQLNEELKKQDPNAPPLTAAEVNRIVDNTDVKSLTPAQYATLKQASGGSQGNPATSIDAANREKLSQDGPENLARARLRSSGSTGDPSPEQIAQAAADLKTIDPGMFDKPPKDVVYVNQKYIDNQGDPRQTKVAAHEFTHLILDHRGVSSKAADGTDPQHAIIGRLGWNQTFGSSGQVIAGETSNWATKPGDGVPPATP